MKAPSKALLLFFCLPFAGCYVGARFDLEAPNLEYPASMSQSVHNEELQVLAPGDYEEVNRFTLSFTGWSIGFPLSPNPKKDISDRLNEIVKEKGGDAIVGLAFTVGNNPLNGATMVVKGISWVTFVASTLALIGNDPNKSGMAITASVSLAAILLLPTAGDFTVSGTVVKFKKTNSSR